MIDRFAQRTTIAYFSMEIALTSEIHTYSGGLGVLAGDTVRSAADLNLPMVFVTLVSRHGYLRQTIDSSGRQVDQPDPWEPADHALPLGAMVTVELEERPVWIRAWLYIHTCPMGHSVPVILLDTEVDQNNPADREITNRLYGGDAAHRLRQEAVLGIGGMHMLEALGFAIRTYHLNEGHAALLTLSLLLRHRHTRHDDALELLLYDPEPVRDRCVFTTHTPVEAGHDQFDYELVERLLKGYIELDQLRLLAGRDRLNMTKLALNLSAFVNGVARRHSETATKMFPGYEIRAITNGVHAATWVHPAIARFLQKVAANWSHEPELLARADEFDTKEIADAHEQAKAELISLVNDRCEIGLDPSKPIIGFGRRMTTYKRPTLVFSDMGRLKAIAARYPFQLVIAGKAHPNDQLGKDLIAEINGHSTELGSDLPVAFLPNYDLVIARTLVAGVDVWLNTPLPPMEASGTSGMKAALNGVLNLSVLDGWWIEAWSEEVTGWAIGGDDATAADDASQLYDKLEQKVLPLYFHQRERWYWMMLQSVAKIGYYFNSQRMMRRYASEAYLGGGPV